MKIYILYNIIEIWSDQMIQGIVLLRSIVIATDCFVKRPDGFFDINALL